MRLASMPKPPPHTSLADLGIRSGRDAIFDARNGPLANHSGLAAKPKPLSNPGLPSLTPFLSGEQSAGGVPDWDCTPSPWASSPIIPLNGTRSVWSPTQKKTSIWAFLGVLREEEEPVDTPPTGTASAALSQLVADDAQKVPDSSNGKKFGVGSSQSPEEVALEVRQNGMTTLMLRNIPNRYTVAQVSAQLDSMGFVDEYDMCLIPIDPSSGHGRGYGFLNFVASDSAARFAEVSHTYNFERGGAKPMQVSAARIQGRQGTLEQHVSGKSRKKARAIESKCLLMRKDDGELEHMGINRALSMVMDSGDDRKSDGNETPPHMPHIAK